jgi:hypothetical protein
MALTDRIGQWVRRAGVNDDSIVADLSVDLADIFAAMSTVSALTERLLTLDPRVPKQADEALTLAAEIEALLFTETKGHLATLEGAWPEFLDSLDRISPDDQSTI